MFFRRAERPILKTPAQLAVMREAGRLVAETLAHLATLVRPGVTTGDLDVAAGAKIAALGGRSSFLGYVVDRKKYPAHICVSVDEEVVHGIPGRCQHGRRVVPDRQLVEGQVVSIDCGVVFEGFHGDSAVTLPVGQVRPEVLRLLEVCRDGLWAGLRAVRPGARLTEVAHAVESTVRGAGAYGVVEEYVGHGIGRKLHEAPQVPNVVTRALKKKDVVLEPGAVLAIEPMVTLGDKRTRTLGDGWTVVTRDGKPAAHFEHTVAVTPTGFEVLTLLADGSATH